MMNWLDNIRDSVSQHIYAEWEDGVLLCGDSFDICPAIPDKSVNLIVNDPPYNIGKAEWDKIPNYLEWCSEWIAEAERVLMDNGSFYLFHNDVEPMAHIIVKIGQETQFIFKNQIVWNKYFDGAFNNGYLKGKTMNENLRHFKQMAEYILFYTFQDETGLSRIYNDRDCFASIKEYMWQQASKAEMTAEKLRDILGRNTLPGMYPHYFGHASQWCLPTAEMYAKLQTTGYFQRPYEQLRQEYEQLRQEYEQLRQEYEQLRYTFNNQKTHHSVWNYETVKNPVHPTQKPVDLIENIILHSSNPGDVVLDMFAGSGTTGVACIRTGRRFICIEKEEEYCAIAIQRIDDEYASIAEEANQLDMFQQAAGD